MARTTSLLPLLLVLAFLPLSSADELDDAREAVKTAHARIATMKKRLDATFKDVEKDFKLTRSREWAEAASPYLAAILNEAAEMGKDKERDPWDGLDASFIKAGFLSEVVSTRLASACVEPLKKAVEKGGDIDAEDILTTALAKVLAGKDHEECWDTSFQDLPIVKSYRAAGKALEDAKAGLKKAEVDAGFDPNAPPGMILIEKTQYKFGPWIGWEFDLKRNKAEKVRVDAYYIDRYEVTNGQYLDFLKGLKDRKKQKAWLPTGFRMKDDGTFIVDEDEWNHPVRGITFTAANAYAASVKKRLPTEQEWELAARGPKGLAYPWGKKFDKEATNYAGSGTGGPKPVGSFKKDRSPFKIMDMAGNVSELTSTLAGRKPAKGKLKPTDAIVYRGGSYAEDEENTANAYRWTMEAISGKSDSVGFRCVMPKKAWKKK